MAQEIGNQVGSLIGRYISNKFKSKKERLKIGSFVGKIARSSAPFLNRGIVKASERT